MMSPGHQIERPIRVPETVEKGPNSFFAVTMMTQPAYSQFKELVKHVAHKYLDLTRAMSYQNKKLLQKHLTTVEKLWPYKDIYEDNWPIYLYTQYYLATMSTWNRAKRKKQPQTHWRNKEVKQLRKTRGSGSSNVQAPQSRASKSVASYKQSETAGSPIAVNKNLNIHSAQAAPVREPEAVRPQYHRVKRGCASQPKSAGTVAAYRAEGAQSAISDADVVHAWFDTIDPPLPAPLVDTLIELGVKNEARLRALARLSDRDQWIERYMVELDQFEFWVLRRALDKLASQQD
ncbi:hypothetical protein DAEQUDRAFT_757911 [Daedalea quercina L-15889]|uniref:Uncharacterized protein n=1 Tax=Daedalea quercina L-15889 TaxID=1314783 RepID=A0A165P6S8_9APHY|nr:hypothetical protein DAEQUDRAFT_757911 [Daedalea quercina L-15889]